MVKIGESAYKLDLPPSMKIHNTFHISLLELYQDDKFPSQRTQPPPPIILEGEPEYELEGIIDSRLHYGKLQYRAQWTGYPPEYDKVWYPYDNFENADIAKQHFHQQYPGKPSHDQDRRSRERRNAGLNITTTASKNDDTETPSTHNPARRMGYQDWATNEPPISKPTRVGGGGGERITSPGARPAVMDSMLLRRVPDPISRQGSLRIVSPRLISVTETRHNRGNATRRIPCGTNATRTNVLSMSKKK